MSSGSLALHFTLVRGRDSALLGRSSDVDHH